MCLSLICLLLTGVSGIRAYERMGGYKKSRSARQNIQNTYPLSTYKSLSPPAWLGFLIHVHVHVFGSSVDRVQRFMER
jgi:hypothetical protein